MFRCAHENYHPPLNPLPSREGKIEESHPLTKESSSCGRDNISLLVGETPHIPSPLVGETHISPLPSWERVRVRGYITKDLLKETAIKAKELGITFRIHPLSPTDVAVCEENPLRNLYISVDGEVSPCVYLYPPLPSPFKRIFCGKEYTMNNLSFGNIFKESFDAIWDKKGYADFRYPFEQRKRRYEEVYSYPIDARKFKKFESQPPA